jgi:hypothetical protein
VVAIEDALTRISAIQARFGTVLGGQALFQGVASDAARHAGLGRDETPVVDPAGAAAGTVASAAASTDALVTAQGVDAIVAELQRSLGGSSTLMDLTGADGDGGELDLLAGLLAQQQARAGLGGGGS